jgi:hypothetical protein
VGGWNVDAGTVDAEPVNADPVAPISPSGRLGGIFGSLLRREPQTMDSLFAFSLSCVVGTPPHSAVTYTVRSYRPPLRGGHSSYVPPSASRRARESASSPKERAVQADCVCGLCLRTVSSDCVYVFVWTVCLRLGYEYCYEVKGIAFSCFFMV